MNIICFCCQNKNEEKIICTVCEKSFHMNCLYIDNPFTFLKDKELFICLHCRVFMFNPNLIIKSSLLPNTDGVFLDRPTDITFKMKKSALEKNEKVVLIIATNNLCHKKEFDDENRFKNLSLNLNGHMIPISKELIELDQKFLTAEKNTLSFQIFSNFKSFDILEMDPEKEKQKFADKSIIVDILHVFVLNHHETISYMLEINLEINKKIKFQLVLDKHFAYFRNSDIVIPVSCKCFSNQQIYCLKVFITSLVDQTEKINKRTFYCDFCKKWLCLFDFYFDTQTFKRYSEFCAKLGPKQTTFVKSLTTNEVIPESFTIRKKSSQSDINARFSDQTIKVNNLDKNVFPMDHSQDFDINEPFFNGNQNFKKRKTFFGHRKSRRGSINSYDNTSFDSKNILSDLKKNNKNNKNNKNEKKEKNMEYQISEIMIEKLLKPSLRRQMDIYNQTVDLVVNKSGFEVHDTQYIYSREFYLVLIGMKQPNSAQIHDKELIFKLRRSYSSHNRAIHTTLLNFGYILIDKGCMNEGYAIDHGLNFISRILSYNLGHLIHRGILFEVCLGITFWKLGYDLKYVNFLNCNIIADFNDKLKEFWTLVYSKGYESFRSVVIRERNDFVEGAVKMMMKLLNVYTRKRLKEITGKKVEKN